MKVKNPVTPSGLRQPEQSKKSRSRRRFLQTAATAGVVAATVPIAGMAQSKAALREPRSRDPLEEILSRYGSEFGDLKEIR